MLYKRKLRRLLLQQGYGPEKSEALAEYWAADRRNRSRSRTVISGIVNDDGTVTAKVSYVKSSFRWAAEFMHPKPSRTLGKISKFFIFIQLLVPPRIANEEIGDALEFIHRLVREGRPRWMIYLKAMSAALFILVNAVREVTSSLLGKSNKA